MIKMEYVIAPSSNKTFLGWQPHRPELTYSIPLVCGLSGLKLGLFLVKLGPVGRQCDILPCAVKVRPVFVVPKLALSLSKNVVPDVPAA